MKPQISSLSRAGRKVKGAGIPLSAAMILVTLGVVYGDIGTSPMYTLKAIISGNGGLATMSEDVVLVRSRSSSGRSPSSPPSSTCSWP